MVLLVVDTQNGISVMQSVLALRKQSVISNNTVHYQKIDIQIRLQEIERKE